MSAFGFVGGVVNHLERLKGLEVICIDFGNWKAELSHKKFYLDSIQI